MNDGSIFSGESLWTRANIDELLDRFGGDNLVKGKEPVLDKFKRQLETAEPAVIQLAAEALWFLYLVWFTTNPQPKRSKIRQVWEWSGHPMPESEYLGDEALKGIARPGRAYIQYFYLELHFLLHLSAQWKILPEAQQSELSHENAAWKFAEWVDSLTEKRRSMRHAILFFLFPDYFERCISYEDKLKIVEKLGARIPENLRPSSKKVSTVEIDRAIYAIRQDLEREYGDTPLDFYSSPITEMWRKDVPGEEATVLPSPNRTRSADALSLNTILYGPPGTGKTYVTARHCVKICDGQAPESDKDIRARYAELVKEKRVEFITFHQSYGYEEFVEGLRPETGQTEPNGQTSPGFRLVAKDGILKRIASRAQQGDNPVPYVLVIDEINRANVSKVLGELVTLLEEDKRQGAENEISVKLPHSGNLFSLPSNLYILGTMNTADRSIALLDTALRRRFEFVELAPDPDKLQTVKKATGIDLPALLRAMNERLEWLLDRDHQIGHAWLMQAETREDVDRIMRHKIIPLMAEYFYEDWKKVCAVLGNTDAFVQGTLLKPPPGLDDETGEDRYQWKIRETFDADAYDQLITASGPAEKNAEE